MTFLTIIWYYFNSNSFALLLSVDFTWPPNPTLTSVVHLVGLTHLPKKKKLAWQGTDLMHNHVLADVDQSCVEAVGCRTSMLRLEPSSDQSEDSDYDSIWTAHSYRMGSISRKGCCSHTFPQSYIMWPCSLRFGFPIVVAASFNGGWYGNSIASSCSLIKYIFIRHNIHLVGRLHTQFIMNMNVMAVIRF